MNNAEFQLRGVSDLRLAVHATSALPAWLWSTDGVRILWANPVGARLFGAANGAVLAEKTFGPADSHRRQVAQLAGRLPLNGAIRLERLRGFNTVLGTLITCGCARLEFADGSHGILVAAAEPVGRAMPLVERLQHLVERIDAPIAAFARDGTLVGASEAARPLLGFGNLSEAGLDQARNDALKQGRAEAAIGIDHMVLQRVGSGGDVGLIALITPAVTEPEPIDKPPPDYEQPALSGEAPAEFALIDEFAEADPEAATSSIEAQHEPSPYIEAVADEPSAATAETPSSPEVSAPDQRRHPLRFTWQRDADGCFSLESDESIRLIGAHGAAGSGRKWSEIVDAFGLDRVAAAVATGSTWSGILLDWPVDGGGVLPVELSGLPVYDHTGKLTGYRGFGVCRDLDGLTRLAALRRDELPGGAPSTPQAASTNADIAAANSANEARLATDLPASDVSMALSTASSGTPEPTPSIMTETSHQTDLETPVETPKNVLPFRPISDPKSPVLTPVENSAFNELARQLSARLDSENGEPAMPATPDVTDAIIEPPDEPQQASEQPGWLARPEPPARGQARDRTLFDLLPVGVLIYRLDRLLYANPAFLAQMGYPSLHALEEDGGLDALYVEPGVSSASSTSDTGTPVTICAGQASSGDQPASAADARLYTIAWDGDSALALIFSGGAGEVTTAPAAIADANPLSEPSAVGHANAEELGAILDTAAEGVMMFDAEGNINSCNRSAEALFGYGGAELVQRNLADLFAPESQRVVGDYLASIKDAGFASLLDHGRDVLGRVPGGGLIPLSMTMGRTRPDGPNFFAVFRDQSQRRKSESELQQARRLTDRAANAKADMLARISHEVRTPLNAIIGFAEVMIGERFGALGNERYVEYMKDIRASGEGVIAIINDLLDLSRIETGKLDLTFANQNLNDLVEQCVAVMQPQANRERIIIRTSLAHMLPPVIADARALRQITLNLIGNSIHLANAGGQVIVSTALSDFGEVVLRVRDTGHGLNDSEVAAAMEPFRTAPPSDQASDNSGVSLSLTKALVEANRAQFQIKTGPHSGTLIEIVFSQAMAKA
jgi:PAS domain S-box-containing protein